MGRISISVVAISSDESRLIGSIVSRMTTHCSIYLDIFTHQQ